MATRRCSRRAVESIPAAIGAPWNTTGSSTQAAATGRTSTSSPRTGTNMPSIQSTSTASSRVAESACAKPKRNSPLPPMAQPSRAACAHGEQGQKRLAPSRSAVRRIQRAPGQPGQREVRTGDDHGSGLVESTRCHSCLYSTRAAVRAHRHPCWIRSRNVSPASSRRCAPGTPDRGQHAGDAARGSRGVARSGCGAARRAGLHRPGPGKGVRRRRRRQPDARPALVGSSIANSRR